MGPISQSRGYGGRVPDNDEEALHAKATQALQHLAPRNSESRRTKSGFNCRLVSGIPIRDSRKRGFTGCGSSVLGAFDPLRKFTTVCFRASQPSLDAAPR